ncbi:MAG: hypothetical protein EYC62_09650 [Alphaproteobacteria bacterium]|nr:MAG: hypothetical protein EYC62_09650 [Alphaproteobacteria bacterium]
MRPSIIEKLDVEIKKGIISEIQVVYLMAQVRKILEIDDSDKYKHLKFYCDWALHSRLTNSIAQKILKQFDEANVILKNHIEIGSLPTDLRNQIEKISSMNLLKEELSSFLEQNGLPGINESLDDWTRFLKLYAHIIEDCPLEMQASNTNAGIQKVTVKVQLGDRVRDHQYYKISWVILNKDKKIGEIFVINSFYDGYKT